MQDHVRTTIREAAAEAENGRIMKRKRGGGRGRGGRGRGKRAAELEGDGEAKGPGKEEPDDREKPPAVRKTRASKLLKNPKASGSKDPLSTLTKKLMTPRKKKKVQQGLEVIRQANLNGLEVPFELSGQPLALTWCACDQCLHLYCCSKLRP
ncbi:unnamed protein product [Symbiodinium sp. CCMP2592]|nr:unnamed protein product [Symbiodinium sp. CCMP2592]